MIPTTLTDDAFKEKMMSNYANACEIIKKMPKGKLIKLIEGILIHDDELCNRLVREHVAVMDKEMLAPILNKIDGVIELDWEDFYDDYSYDRRRGYRYGGDYEEPYERWISEIKETISDEVDKLVEDGHAQAAWLVIEHVLKKPMGNDYGEEEEVKDSCLYLLPDLYRQATKQTQEAILGYFEGQFKQDAMSLSYFLGEFLFGPILTNDKLQRFGQLFINQWLSKKADCLREAKSTNERRYYPTTLDNLLTYYAKTKNWDNYDREIHDCQNVFPALKDRAIDDAKEYHRDDVELYWFEKKFKEEKSHSEQDYRMFVDALIKAGKKSEAAKIFEEMLFSSHYFPPIDDVRKLRSLVTPSQWADIKPRLLALSDHSNSPWIHSWVYENRAVFFLMEKMYEPLWTLVEKARYDDVYHYWPTLVELDSSRASRWLVNLSKNWHAPTSDHEVYRQMVRDIENLQSIPGNDQLVQEVLNDWKSRYPQRRLLWRYLREAGINV